MCLDPTILTTIAMAGAGAVKSTMEVMNANRTATAMGENAAYAAATDYAVLDARVRQLDDKATQDAMERQRQALRDRSRIMVAAGEAGVGGNSLLRDIHNTMVQADYDRGIIQANREVGVADTVMAKRGVYAEHQGRYNAAKSMAYNPFTSALKIGASTVQGGLAGYNMGGRLFPSSASVSQAGHIPSRGNLPMPDHYIRGR